MVSYVNGQIKFKDNDLRSKVVTVTKNSHLTKKKKKKKKKGKNSNMNIYECRAYIWMLRVITNILTQNKFISFKNMAK